MSWFSRLFKHDHVNNTEKHIKPCFEEVVWNIQEPARLSVYSRECELVMKAIYRKEYDWVIDFLKGKRVKCSYHDFYNIICQVAKYPHLETFKVVCEVFEYPPWHTKVVRGLLNYFPSNDDKNKEDILEYIVNTNIFFESTNLDIKDSLYSMLVLLGPYESMSINFIQKTFSKRRDQEYMTIVSPYYNPSYKLLDSEIIQVMKDTRWHPKNKLFMTNITTNIMNYIFEKRDGKVPSNIMYFVMQGDHHDMFLKLINRFHETDYEDIIRIMPQFVTQFTPQQYDIYFKRYVPVKKACILAMNKNNKELFEYICGCLDESTEDLCMDDLHLISPFVKFEHVKMFLEKWFSCTVCQRQRLRYYDMEAYVFHRLDLVYLFVNHGVIDRQPVAWMQKALENQAVISYLTWFRERPRLVLEKLNDILDESVDTTVIKDIETKLKKIICVPNTSCDEKRFVRYEWQL
jgi:hypothetical protein